MTDKLTVHLWDEISGEWGETYVSPPDGSNNNHLIHQLVERSIDHDPVDEEDKTKIKYAIWTPSLSLNIGTYGRGMLYVEIWGPDAEGVVNLLGTTSTHPEMDPELSWSPANMRQALRDIVWAQDELHRRKG